MADVKENARPEGRASNPWRAASPSIDHPEAIETEGERHPDEDHRGKDQQHRAELHRPAALVLDGEPQVPGRRREQPEGGKRGQDALQRSEEHTSELQSLMRISYAVFCLKKKTKTTS